jgi:hypothetical protein
MSLPANELQKAVYSRLAAELAGVPIYDFVPQGSAYPYVVVGDLASLPWDTKTEDGQEFTVTIHAFDKAAGKKTVQLYAQMIYEVLHERPGGLAMDGFTAAFCRCEFNEAFQDPPPEGDVDHYFHAVQRYRVLVQDD